MLTPFHADAMPCDVLACMVAVPTLDVLACMVAVPPACMVAVPPSTYLHAWWRCHPRRRTCMHGGGAMPCRRHAMLTPCHAEPMPYRRHAMPKPCHADAMPCRPHAMPTPCHADAMPCRCHAMLTPCHADAMPCARVQRGHPPHDPRVKRAPGYRLASPPSLGRAWECAAGGVALLEVPPLSPFQRCDSGRPALLTLTCTCGSAYVWRPQRGARSGPRLC